MTAANDARDERLVLAQLTADGWTTARGVSDRLIAVSLKRVVCALRRASDSGRVRVRVDAPLRPEHTSLYQLVGDEKDLT